MDAHSAAPPSPTPQEELPDASDLAMVVVDMDGTLLDDNKQLPEGIWELVAQLRDRGITFVPASGRQYATLAHMFDPIATGTPFIAENGTLVVRDGETLSSLTIDRDTVSRIVTTVREVIATGVDAGVVVCGKQSAYIERHDEAFLEEGVKYYHHLEILPDVLDYDDEIIKVAVYSFSTAERTVFPPLRHFREDLQVVVSGENWVDIMANGANKGAAVRALQQELGIGPAQTAAFGDFLNDLEMIDAAELSFAMANAHPTIIDHANYVAPSNADHGVLVTLRQLLDL